MAQDVVGRGDVKEELRHAEGEQQLLTGKVSRRAVLEGENHFLLAAVVDRRGSQTADETDRGGDPRLEFGNIRLGIGKDRRIDASQQTAGKNRMPDRLFDLEREAVHVGIEPRGKEDRRINLARLGMFSRAVEKVGQTSEKLRENPDRGSMHRYGHWCDSPARCECRIAEFDEGLFPHRGLACQPWPA